MRKVYVALAAGVAMSAMSPAMARRHTPPAATPPDICTAPMASAVGATPPAAGAASSATPAAEPAVAPAPAASPNAMLAGTEVRMLTRTELNSQTSHLGDRFELTVACDVSHDGQVVIPAGSVATGEVTRVRKKGGWGRSGILETRLISVNLGDHQIRLHGVAGDRGHAGTAAVVGAILLSPLIVAPFVGFFVTGTSAVVAQNSYTVGYTDENVPVLAANATPLTTEAQAAPAPTASETPPASTPHSN